MKTNTVSSSPRTDAFLSSLTIWEENGLGPRPSLRDFARQLESKLSEALEKLDRANTPFEDADTRIEVFRQETWYAYRVPNGGEVAPFQTWREAYRAAESHLHQIDLHSATTSRDEALAACGEMRATLSPLVYSEKCAFKPSEIGSCINSDFTRDRWCGSCIRLERTRKALSTTCGQGWKSPEEWRQAEITFPFFKAAVIDALIVAHIFRKEHETDPKKALADLITWEIQVATDERVNGGLRLVEVSTLDELARLRAEVENYKDSITNLTAAMKDAIADRDTAQQQARASEERVRVLSRYARHNSDCDNFIRCTCGLEEALAKPASVPGGALLDEITRTPYEL